MDIIPNSNTDLIVMVSDQRLPIVGFRVDPDMGYGIALVMAPTGNVLPLTELGAQARVVDLAQLRDERNAKTFTELFG